MPLETRKFRPHPQLLMDVIRRQAGTLSKAILEAAMNAVDAKATKCVITLTRNKVTIADDGGGFKGRKEIEEFFEVFGQPHAEGDSVYGRFRMGRGQLFAFGRNAWRSHTFRMAVDILKDGLDYHLEDGLESAAGCNIEIDLYSPLSNAELHDTEREFGLFAAYAAIPVVVNGRQVSSPPANEKWDYETDDGYVKLGGGSLKVYNLGVLVREFHSGHYGTGGTVVSKQPLQVCFARNDILSTCKVWERLKSFVRRKADDGMKKKSLDDAGRQRLAEKFHEGVDYYELSKAKIITDVSGKHHALWSFVGQKRVCVAPDHDRKGDYLMQTGRAFVVAHSTLERFDVRTLRELLDLLLEAGADDEGIGEMEILNFEKLAKEADSDYRLVPEKQWRPIERTWMKLGERFHYLCYKWKWQQHRDGMAIDDGDDDYIDMQERFDRDISIGVADAHGWTDGKTYIAINRDWLARRKLASLADIFEFGRLMLHEYCHDDTDVGTDVHGPEFDAAFREQVGMIGLFAEWAVSEIPKLAEAEQRLATKLSAKAKDKLERLAKAGRTMELIAGQAVAAEAVPR